VSQEPLEFFNSLLEVVALLTHGSPLGLRRERAALSVTDAQTRWR
jgi:hypothetical protein